MDNRSGQVHTLNCAERLDVSLLQLFTSVCACLSQILQGLEGGQSGSGRLGAWVEQYYDVCTPSCVLVHIGTNDVVRRTASTETILANIRTMITQLSAKFPSTLRVLVATYV